MTHQSESERKTRKELVSEWRQQEVLSAARRIFARLGYESANVEEIAREAGMAKGTLYLYFKSKEEVYAAVLANDLEALTNQTIEGMSAVTTFEERLWVFLRLRMAFLANNRDFLTIYFSGAGFGSRRETYSRLISEVIEKPFWRIVAFLRQCMEQAIAEGELRPVPVEAAVFSMLDISRGFLERHLRGWAHLSVEEDLAFTHSLILRGLKK